MKISKREFDKIRNDVISQNSSGNGIGELGERSLHRILKYCYEPDSSYHEIKTANYVADICRDGEITEIQTRNFFKLNAKLAEFIKNYRVNVVFPIARNKYINIDDEQSGEIVSRRKSPKKGSYFDLFREMYSIRGLLPNDKIQFDAVLCDMEEYRIPNKKRKGHSVRIERFPSEFVSQKSFVCLKDYLSVMPEELSGGFTAAELAKITGQSKYQGSLSLQLLRTIGVIKLSGKQGRANLYSFVKNDS